MSKELIVSSTAHETKVGILEDDELVEVFFERERQHGLAGSIYKGRVTRVLPGMQSAFVNIGLERDAFLYVSDFFEDNEEYERIVTTVEDKVVRMQEAPGRDTPAVPKESADEAPATAAEPSNGGPVAAVERGPEPEPREPAPATPPEDVERRTYSEPFHRRGRRGRRRRGGRGFPESKYASRPETTVASQPVASPPPASSFEVLPGESLAKYGPSHPADQEAAGVRAEEPEFEESRESEAVDEDVLDGVVAENLPETAVPESPLTEAVSESEAPVAEALAAAETEAPPEPESAEAEVEAEPATEPPSESAPAADGSWSSPVAAEEEAPLAGEAGSAGDVESESAAGQTATSPETPGEAQAEPAAPVPGRPEPEPGGQASVRERTYGKRYLHRGSRRMRRRGRDFRDRRGPEPAAAVATEAAPAQPGEASITDLLKEGQEIIVQIAKEPIGKKGARITSHIALPGRYLVYMPTVDHVGVSRKIVSEEERSRLKRIVQTHRVGMPGGFIVRTAGDGVPEDEIRSDMHFLYNLWLDIRQKAERRPAPALIHHDLNLVERLLRDQLTETFKTIWVDSQDDYERILGFVERFQPGLVNRVKLYTRSNPIFDEFAITPELEKALRPKVWLKSGGYIVINQTEALVAIDVNTGKYVGKSNRLEDTIVKTNMDAIKEIVRQIRLRDLGGIIVVDFIDMDERKNRHKVMQALDEALRHDRAPSKILQFNDFGLVAITRKRVKQSLERTLCAPCPYCDASGYVKSVTTMIQEILTEAKKISHTLEDGRDITLRVNPEVARTLKSRNNAYLEEIEAILHRPVLVKSDPLLHQERFDFN